MRALRVSVCAIVAGVAVACGAGRSTGAGGLLIPTVYPAAQPKGLMVTNGGWAYCQQVRALARRTGYTLLCGRYVKDGYTDASLRSQRHLDWGNPQYLSEFAAEIRTRHLEVGGRLLLIGVSYSGFGVATLASHHPEIRPDRVVVIDSYLDLPARRRGASPSHPTAREIDLETGGSDEELRRRSVRVEGLARLVRAGTELAVIWTVSEQERRFFRGVTCNRDASAATLARLARLLRRPVRAWVTKTKHGHNLWDNGTQIVAGRYPGRKVAFRPDGLIPRGSTC